MFGIKQKNPLIETESNWIMNSGQYFLDAFPETDFLSKKTIFPDDLFTFNHISFESTVDELIGKIAPAMDVETAFNVEYIGQNAHRKILSNIPHSDRGEKSFAGLYKDEAIPQIAIKEELIHEPLALVATIAHEIAHYKLIAQKDLRNYDEQLTDLLPVFYGFGIFSANSVVNFQQWTDPSLQGWSLSRLGYLDEYVLGFAIAVNALYKNENQKAIYKQLKPNPGDLFRKTIRFVTGQDFPIWNDTIRYDGVIPSLKIKVSCPKCDWQPFHDSKWQCECGYGWNTFETHGICPSCGKQWEETVCFHCKEMSTHDDWYTNLA